MSHNDYEDEEHALAYLANANRIPHRQEGEGVLLSFMPRHSRRVLDLGTGDGRLVALLMPHCQEATFVGLDGSPTMIEAAQRQFGGESRVAFRLHDLEQPLPDLGLFDVIVSSFAIHHCTNRRKRQLYQEIFDCLTPGGVFCNLEHVASATSGLHGRFLAALGIGPDDEDAGNILLDVETQLNWLREIGFDDVDCYWKWLELSLFGGIKNAECQER